MKEETNNEQSSLLREWKIEKVVDWSIHWRSIAMVFNTVQIYLEYKKVIDFDFSHVGAIKSPRRSMKWQIWLFSTVPSFTITLYDTVPQFVGGVSKDL